MSELEQICSEIRACRACEAELPLGPRPVIQVSATARILVVGQAPGRRVHETGLPFNDPSGDRLRSWMGLSREQFYDPARVAIVPMGFCYPGSGARGDLPPRPECARLWRVRLLEQMGNIELTLAIGRYAQQYHLQGQLKGTLTETVKGWRNYAPALFALPHPSPRNNNWFKNNPWFEQEVIPALQQAVQAQLNKP